jgi:hypothetical protein
MDRENRFSYAKAASIPSSREPSRPSSRETSLSRRALQSMIKYPQDNKENIPPIGLSTTPPKIQIGHRKQIIPVQYDKGFGEEPYGKVTKCALHGEVCDGVSVGHLHLTEATRQGRGFQESYPMIHRRGREIVDWVRIMNEERVQMGMVPIVHRD